MNGRAAKFLACAVVSATLGCGDSREGTGTAPEAPINAAVQAFYDPKWAGLTDWSTGDFVVVTLQYSSESPTNFDAKLAEMLRSVQRQGQLPGDKDAEILLSKISGSIDHSRQVPPSRPATPLQAMQLDSRIVLFDMGNFGSNGTTVTTISNRLGKSGSVRLSGSLEPPTYSADGRYAIVRFVDIRGTAELSSSGRASVLLERQQGRWIVRWAAGGYSRPIG